MKTKPLIFVLLLSISSAFAQKLSVVEGSFKNLQGLSKVNVVFHYDNLKLMKENKSEAEYVKERTAELNGKSAGSGDTWAKRWEGAKTSIWEPNFMDLLNKTLTAKKGVTFTQDGSAPITLHVDADWIYPGWDAGVMKQPAKVSTTLTFKEGNKVLVKIKSENAPGDQWGSNFSNESRIGEGFEKTAKTLGNRVIKEAF
jgi:hypothetical protein